MIVWNDEHYLFIGICLIDSPEDLVYFRRLVVTFEKLKKLMI